MTTLHAQAARVLGKRLSSGARAGPATGAVRMLARVGGGASINVYMTTSRSRCAQRGRSRGGGLAMRREGESDGCRGPKSATDGIS